MYNIFGFYKFKKITNLRKKKELLDNYLKQENFRGTIILSPEGVNGTINFKIDRYISIRKTKMKTQTKTNESGSFAMRVFCSSFTIIRILSGELCQPESHQRTTSPKRHNFYSKPVTNRHLSRQIRPGTILTISWAHPNHPEHPADDFPKKGHN